MWSEEYFLKGGSQHYRMDEIFTTISAWGYQSKLGWIRMVGEWKLLGKDVRVPWRLYLDMASSLYVSTGRLYFQCGLIPLKEQTKGDSWAKFFYALNFRVDQETIPHVQLRSVPRKSLAVVVAPVGLLVLSNHEKAITSNVTGWV